MPKSEEVVTLSFDTAVYGLETIKKAAYRLIDRAVVEISLGDGAVICVVRHRDSNRAIEVQQLADELRAEVLDQDLRRLIGEETAPVRNAVLAYAFSRTGLQGDV